MKGMCLILMASSLYGMIPSFQKMTMTAGVSPVALSACTYFLNAVISLGLIRRRGYELRISGKQLVFLALTGIIGLGCSMLLINFSFCFLPVGLVTTIHFMYPCWVCIIMTLLFKERFTRQKLLALFLTASGLLLLGFSLGEVSFAGIVLAVLSSLTYAFFLVCNEKSCISSLPGPVKTFWSALSISLTFLIAALLIGLPFPQTIGTWTGTALLGIASWSAMFMTVLGIPLIGASKASIFCIVEPVVSLIFSSLLFSVHLSARDFLGAALMLCAVALNAFEDIRLRKADFI